GLPQKAHDLRFGKSLLHRPTLSLGRTLNRNATQNRGDVIITECKLGPPFDDGSGTPIQGSSFTINQGGGFVVVGQFDSSSRAHGTLTTAPGYFGSVTSQTQFSWTATKN
ncbi:MAG TPA: hypothetical protein VLV86_00390, partial [Vicinamibacterales bacterium]|nr:hypothetical protein [Vicinamibacterales bacterium]